MYKISIQYTNLLKRYRTETICVTYQTDARMYGQQWYYMPPTTGNGGGIIRKISCWYPLPSGAMPDFVDLARLTCSIHQMYSSSVSPFQAYTGTPVLAMAAAAKSCVEKILQLDHWTCEERKFTVQLNVLSKSTPTPSSAVGKSLSWWALNEWLVTSEWLTAPNFPSLHGEEIRTFI